MFKFLRLFRRNSNREVTDSLYEAIVASARQPAFYSQWDVPDTPIGRYEMLSIHMFLFLQRASSGSDALVHLSQDLTDEFFKDVDHSLRELGIGDAGVPKRMKKLAKMFYGRADSYARALAAEDKEALEAALSRNIMPQRDTPWPQVGHLASYIERATKSLASQEDSEFLSGRINFPVAE